LYDLSQKFKWEIIVAAGSTLLKGPNQTFQASIEEIERDLRSLDLGDQGGHELLSRINRLYREVNRAGETQRSLEGLFPGTPSSLNVTQKDRIKELFDKALQKQFISEGVVYYRYKDLHILVETGNFEGLKFLLRHGIKLPEEVVGIAATKAASGGYLDYLEFLLSDGRNLRPHQRTWALRDAAINGHLECVKFLLAGDCGIEKADLALPVKHAALNGHLECLRVLLSEGRTLSEKDLSTAATCAASKGHLECLQFLQNSGLYKGPLVFLVSHAATNGHLECLHFLLTDGRTLAKVEMFGVILNAATNGHLECLKFLLSDGRNIDTFMVGKVLNAAALRGHLGCLQFLLSMGRTATAFEIAQAAVQAVSGGHAECLQFLLSLQIPISLAYRQHILLLCASSGYLDCIELILRQGPIERSAIDSAITQASGEHRHAIRDMLRSAHVIDNLGTALKDGFQIDSISHVASDPIFYLNEIIKGCFPERIVLTGKSAVDLGGITKEFIFTLFSSLASNLDLDRNLLPFPQTDEKKELFVKIGKVLSMLCKKNRDRTDKFLIGSLFHIKFYEILQLALQKGKGQELNELVAQILTDLDQSYKVTAQVILHPKNQGFKQEFADQFLCEIAEVDQTVAKIFESYSNGALWMLEGADERFKATIRSNSAENLYLMCQGKQATIDLIKAAIRLQASNELLEVQKAWLFQILDESDLPWREKFLTYVTGRDVLMHGTAITLKTTWREQSVFEAHTCFNTLDLPNVQFESKEHFLLHLNAAMGREYNTA
jgi:ankyrin repeat protein